MTESVAIVGAGISGLACGNILLENGIDSILFDPNPIGGLVSCTSEEDFLYHRVGGHVFNSKNQDVLDWFWKRFDKDKEFTKANRHAVIYLDGKFINYPIELSLKSLEPETGRKIINELICLSSRDELSSNTDNFKDWLVSNFGQTLCQLYFLPYNEKIWRRDLSQIPLDWLSGKLPMISANDILTQNIMSVGDDMVHSTFYYPVSGGSQFIANRLAEPLTIRQERVISIRNSGQAYYINEHPYPFQSIIYTGSLRDIPALLTDDSSDLDRNNTVLTDIFALDYNPTTTLLCECDANPYSWIYFPDNSFKVHRAIITGNFSAHNNPSSLPSGRSSCTIEFSGLASKQEMYDEAKKLPFNMKPISYNHCASSYILHNKDTKQMVVRMRNYLASRSIYTCGRFAEWQYYNMDAAISSAMKLVSSYYS